MTTFPSNWDWHAASMSLKRTVSLEVLVDEKDLQGDLQEGYSPLEPTWSNEAVCESEEFEGFKKKRQKKKKKEKHHKSKRSTGTSTVQIKSILRKVTGDSQPKKVMFGDSNVEIYVVDTIKKKMADRKKRKKRK